MQGNYRTSTVPRYCCPNHHRFTSKFYSWNQAFRNTGFLGRSPNINLTWFCEQRRRTTHFTILRISNHEASGFMIITPSFSLISLVFSIGSSATAALPRMLDLWSSRQSVFVGTAFKMNTEVCCHLCCSSSMIFIYNPLPCTATPFTWFWFSATVPLSLWRLPMMCMPS